MAFFLGMSLVTLLECLCYLGVCTVRRCTREAEEEQERQDWKENMNQNEVEDEDAARRRAAMRQQRFNEMQERLRRMELEQ